MKKNQLIIIILLSSLLLQQTHALCVFDDINNNEDSNKQIIPTIDRMCSFAKQKKIKEKNNLDQIIDDFTSVSKFLKNNDLCRIKKTPVLTSFMNMLTVGMKSDISPTIRKNPDDVYYLKYIVNKFNLCGLNIFSVAPNQPVAKKPEDNLNSTAKKYVIIFSGSSGTAEDYLQLICSEYTKLGYTCIYFNYRGFGGRFADINNPNNEILDLHSGSKTFTPNIITIVEDALEMLDYVSSECLNSSKDQGNNNRPEIILHGFSLGAYAMSSALYMAFENKQNRFKNLKKSLKGVVFDRPFVDLELSVKGFSPSITKKIVPKVAKKVLGNMNSTQRIIHKIVEDSIDRPLTYIGKFYLIHDKVGELKDSHEEFGSNEYFSSSSKGYNQKYHENNNDTIDFIKNTFRPKSRPSLRSPGSPKIFNNNNNSSEQEENVIP